MRALLATNRGTVILIQELEGPDVVREYRLSAMSASTLLASLETALGCSRAALVEDIRSRRRCANCGHRWLNHTSRPLVDPIKCGGGEKVGDCTCKGFVEP